MPKKRSTDVAQVRPPKNLIKNESIKMHVCIFKWSSRIVVVQISLLQLYFFVFCRGGLHRFSYQKQSILYIFYVIFSVHFTLIGTQLQDIIIIIHFTTAVNIKFKKS